MSLLDKVSEAIAVLNKINELKVALGFSSSDSIESIITKVEASAAALVAATTAASTTDADPS